jgi:hypothetical protein
MACLGGRAPPAQPYTCPFVASYGTRTLWTTGQGLPLVRGGRLSPSMGRNGSGTATRRSDAPGHRR